MSQIPAAQISRILAINFNADEAALNRGECDEFGHEPEAAFPFCGRCGLPA